MSKFSFRFNRDYIHLYLVGALLLVYAFICAKSNAQSDFTVQLHAAGKLTEGMNIYFDPFLDGAQYYYSPFFALLLSPYAYLFDFGQLAVDINHQELIYRSIYGELIWLVLNIIFLYRIWRVLELNFDLSLFKRKQQLWIFFLTLILIARPLEYNFKQIQMTIFLVWASLEGIHQILNNKKILGAFILALAINIKILPILLVIYLLYRKEFKALAYLVLFEVILLFLPALFIGWEYNSFLLGEWFTIMNPIGKVNISPDHHENYYGFHSLGALVNSLFVENHLPIRTHLVNIGYDNAVWIAHSLRLVLLFLTLYFLKSMPFKRAKSPIQNHYELSYILLITPLIFPHQQKYSFFYMLPACFYILYFLYAQKESGYTHLGKHKCRNIIIWMSVVFALTTLTSDGLIGKDLNSITQYLKLITYGGIILIVPLALCKVDLLENAQADLKEKQVH